MTPYHDSLPNGLHVSPLWLPLMAPLHGSLHAPLYVPSIAPLLAPPFIFLSGLPIMTPLHGVEMMKRACLEQLAGGF